MNDRSALDASGAHASGRRSRTVNSFRRLPSAGRTLTQSAFFLKCHVQPFCEAAEREGGTPQRGVLLGQSCEFLATTRTVISHKHSPFRSSRTFEGNDIHTGHNECGLENRTGQSGRTPRGSFMPATVSGRG
jgi:hypothetical protein